jgi:TolB-like protein/Flp pilus assembly protein TadD
MAFTASLQEEPFAFGRFVLDTDRLTLTRDGDFVPLGIRAIQLLCVLVEARGGLVTKDDLMARVWLGVAVGENNLHVQISALRKALGEDVGGQRYVITVPGRGYRFAATRPDLQNGHSVSQPLAAADHKNLAGPVVPPPNRASIAVLPFTNMSEDSTQDYFADGILEEIITSLTRLRWLLVIASDSSFTYKNRAVDVKQVGRELGVRYVLEGSMRRTATRVRITAQLIDATTGTHLWADHFDAEPGDVFELQERLTGRVVGAIAPQLEQAEIARAKRKPTTNLDAYDCYLRGLACVHRETGDSVAEAIELFRRAIDLDPDYASAHGMAAWCYCLRKEHGWACDRARDIAEATRFGWRAVELGQDDAVALAMGGRTLVYVAGDIDSGAAFIERALVLNPNLTPALNGSGWVKTRLGDPETALERLTRAIRLSPLDPLMFNMQNGIAFAHFFSARYDEAARGAEKVLSERPANGAALRIATVSHALAGRLTQARQFRERLCQVCPNLRVSNLNDQTPLRREEDRARWAEGMRKAGLPE